MGFCFCFCLYYTLKKRPTGKELLSLIPKGKYPAGNSTILEAWESSELED